MTVRRKSAEVVESVYNFPEADILLKNQDEKVEKSEKDCFFLYFAAFAGSLAFFGAGECLIWTSPVVSQLQSNDFTINPLKTPASAYDLSLIVGIFSGGSIVSSFFCGKVGDVLGRKNALLVSSILNMSALILLAYATDMLWILIARAISGICAGGNFIILPIFLSEITDNHNRGKFGCLMNLFLPLGQLYGYVMGCFFSVKLFTLVCVLPVALQILLLFFVAESPVHLLHKGDRGAAIKSLKKYRANKSLHELEKDIQVMEYTLLETTKGHKGGWISLFSHQPSRRGFVIGAGMILVQMGTGVAVILSFLGPIFEEAESGISGNMTAVLVGSLKILTYLFVSQIIERLGRKPLMLTSTVLCCIALSILGLYFFTKERNLDIFENFSWLPVVSILFFILAYALGLGPIPMATMSELFASNVRATAVSFINLFSTIYNTIFTTLFPIMMNILGISTCMFFFSVSCALGAVFLYFIMPETKGKSVHEIQEILKGKNESYNKVAN